MGQQGYYPQYIGQIPQGKTVQFLKILLSKEIFFNIYIINIYNNLIIILYSPSFFFSFMFEYSLSFSAISHSQSPQISTPIYFSHISLPVILLFFF